MSNNTDVPENCVRRVPFAKLSEKKISLHGVPECRLRFIDCRSFASREELRILEFTELPRKKYSAISYVWKGRKPKTEIIPPTGWIEIEGAEGADKICIDVLRLACETSLRLGCDLVWLDGLSIIQGNEVDRVWQIHHMYDIYSSCAECIIIPGGLSRLVPLTEETNWIHRAWTLQEALAPPSCQCLFSWAGGSCHFQANFPVLVQEIEEGTAALANMEGLLQMSLKQSFKIIKAKSKQDSDFKIIIFGNNEEQFSQIAALIGALDLRGQEGMANAVWRSSFMRTAKFPVDMVYSIMGLLGVTIDASNFENEHRVEATTALMKEILRKGGRAEWLSIATRMEPNPVISTIPVFPRYSSSGRAVVTVDGKDVDACSLMDGWWKIQNTPTGTVDDEGYLQIEAQAAVVQSSDADISDTVFESVTLGKWEIASGEEGSHYAVQIGTKEQYTNGIFGMMVDPFKCALMLIKEHAPGKFSVDGYAFVEEEVLKAPGWSQRSFSVGGPGS